MSLDSTAVFAERVEELKLGLVLNDTFVKGWDAIGSSAFSCLFAPGNSDDNVSIREVNVPLWRNADHNFKTQLKWALLRVLHSGRSGRPAQSYPSLRLKGPGVPRDKKVRPALNGLVMRDDLEPSSAFFDRFMMPTVEHPLRP